MQRLTSACVLLVAACTNPGEIVEPSNDDTTDDIADTGDQTGDETGDDGDGTGTEPDSDDDTSDNPYAQPAGPYFTTPMFWNQDVSAAAKAPNSDSMIAALAAAGGWGNNNRFTIDFTIDVLTASPSTPTKTFTKTADFYAPDCDDVPMPMPVGGNVESSSSYACTTGGDCHLLVHDPVAGTLHEMFRANLAGSTFYGGCLAVWDTHAAYDSSMRGDQCSSADAAGFPIAPLLFSADEVAAGEIDHAIRFILPNDRVKRGFVRPATHGSSTTGGTNAPPYGVHLRLRADFPVDSLPTAGAKVVARALQKYGMYHADGGQVALTAQSDRHTTAKWAGVLGPQDLLALKVSDFEVIDHGAMIPLTYACNR